MEPAPETPLPEVAVNFALTWDGRVSTRARTRADFSSPRDKHRLLELRAGADAVVAGRVTVETERMRMSLPDAELRADRVRRGLPPEPLRVVVSGSGALDPAARIFQTDAPPLLVFSTEQMPVPTRAALAAARATLHLGPGPRVDLRGMLALLRGRYGVRRVMCEGGPGLLRSLLEAGLVNEINVTFCPRVFGGAEAPALTGGPGSFFPSAVECRLESLEPLGGECFARYSVISHNP
ncbi:MAG: dihydrofolate reductase family protein [Chthoniobacteraceae bacterium]|nr:dihydrofolate reductase family protein [Chthoniobacteraceae bacterium]